MRGPKGGSRIVDTAQRDDVVPEDDGGGASGAVTGLTVTSDTDVVSA